MGDPGTGLLAEELRHGPFREVDARQLVVSIIALCFFPFAHAGGLLKELGLDLQDSASLEERKRHVIDLVLRGILVPEQRGG